MTPTPTIRRKPKRPVRSLMAHQTRAFAYGTGEPHPAFFMDEESGICGFPGYVISTCGSVWNRRGRLLRLDPEGRIKLCRNGVQRRVRVSVLVLETFVCLRPAGLIACHKDDNQQNNKLSNLYWGTYSDNVKDAIRNGTRYQPDNRGVKRSDEFRRNASEKMKEVWSLRL
jgi:hypothetical protein